MEIKLDFEQRHRANELLEQISSGVIDIETLIFEFVATRDSYNKLRRLGATLRYADNSQKYGRLPVIKDGVEINTVGNILAEMYA